MSPYNHRLLYMDVKGVENSIFVFREVHRLRSMKSGGSSFSIRLPKFSKWNSTTFFVNLCLIGFVTLTYMEYHDRQLQTKQWKKVKQECLAELRRFCRSREQRSANENWTEDDDVEFKFVDACTQTEEFPTLEPLYEELLMDEVKSHPYSSDNEYETLDE